MASLFPILAVLLLGLYHYNVEDYYGAQNYRGAIIEEIPQTQNEAVAESNSITFTQEEFQQYQSSGQLSTSHELTVQGGTAVYRDGAIVLENPLVLIEKQESVADVEVPNWDASKSLSSTIKTATYDALRAIIPLCIFLYLVLRYLLGQRLQHPTESAIGVGFAVLGMTLFGLGISIGLTPLGSQLGSNVPSTFAEVSVWQSAINSGPIIETGEWGKIVAIVFAFFLGYGATLAEPALNALGDTVEKITVGAFKKSLLMQSVAIGVGLGIAAGILKIAYNIPLLYLLAPPYLVLLFLTWISEEDFVNFGWDSAGVTTGPITVPLVLAIGLGVGGNVPGVLDGFGVLALASVGPIMTVLSVGLYTRMRKQQMDEALEV
ncbi:MAG: DUF1538 domain-containing protein [Pseudomonadales bacterium]|nr:DUF1538 domain-containing protein [Pseudomonadales bacterium]